MLVTAASAVGAPIGNVLAAWTPDSQRVVFGTLTGFWLIEPNGGGRPRPPSRTSGRRHFDSAFRDGRTLSVYSGRDQLAPISTRCLSTGPPRTTPVREHAG